MKAKAPVTNSERRLVPIKEKNNQLIVQSKTELCFNCNRNTISPYETYFCDFCADEFRYTPRTM
jgi:hypothetical protein